MIRLIDKLVEHGRIGPDVAAAALADIEESASDRQIGDWLIRQGHCTELEVLAGLGELTRTPVLEVIDEGALDPDLIKQVPVDWVRNRHVLPIRRGQQLMVVTDDPARSQDFEDLALLLGEEFDLALAPRQIILTAIERCYFNRRETTDSFLQTLATEQGPVAPETRSDDLLRVTDQAPVTQMVNLILLDAMKSAASDIHIEPYQNTVRVRFRVDGILSERAAPPKQMQAALISRLKVMAHLDIAEKRMPQDGAARVRIGEREIDIRVSTVPVAEGERIVLRLLNRDATLLPLSDLGLSAEMTSRIQPLLREPFGVIWVTGPTGSGKTTTLYAALRELDTRRLNVITIEDPVEYQLPTISQISINPKIGLTFARGLRHILRQDPDVILVGETRDQETAEIVVRSSLTGHLVFSTLHTNDAVSAPIRLIDMGVESYLVAAATRAVLAQRLVRRLCPACRRETTLPDSARQQLGRRADPLQGVPLWEAHPAGCDRCVEGYRGRIGLFELMPVNPGLAEVIRQGAGLRDVRRAATDMITLLDDGLEKMRNGMTSLDELERVVGWNADEDL